MTQDAETDDEIFDYITVKYPCPALFVLATSFFFSCRVLSIRFIRSLDDKK